MRLINKCSLYTSLNSIPFLISLALKLRLGSRSHFPMLLFNDCVNVAHMPKLSLSMAAADKTYILALLFIDVSPASHYIGLQFSKGRTEKYVKVYCTLECKFDHVMMTRCCRSVIQLRQGEGHYFKWKYA